MKNHVWLWCLCVLFSGCDFSIPLVDTPSLDMDTGLTGLWHRTDAPGQDTHLLVLPLSDKEYLIVFPAGTTNALFARGSLWQQAEARLVQLDWFGTARGKQPANNRTFQFASYVADSDTLRVRLLNPDAVTLEEQTPEALAKAVTALADHPSRFRGEMRFQRAPE